jgi:membrane-associated protease RseP (regulator of RpoE activity)
MVKEFLSQKGVRFRERDVSVDRGAAEEMVSLTRQMGVPVTAIDGQFVIGFDRPKLEHVLAHTAAAPGLGAAVADAAKVAAMRGSPSASGAYVGGVKPGSAAQRMGLAIGDVIIEVNKSPVASADDLEHIIETLQPGSRLLVVIQRDGSRKAIEGTL